MSATPAPTASKLSNGRTNAPAGNTSILIRPGANGAIVLGVAGCATAPGITSATVVSGATVGASLRLSRWHCTVCDGCGWSAWSRARGEGINRNQRIKPVQNELPMHLSRRCGARTRNGSPCRSAAMPNGRCRMHGGMSPGAPKGNTNAFKHGHYTAEAIASRREIAKLLRDARGLVKQVS